MNAIKDIFGAAAAQPIEAVGNVLDKLFTSDDERLTKREALLRLVQAPHLAQAEISKTEAQHRSVWVAGWRPAIGWSAAVALFTYYVPQFTLGSYLWFVQSLEANQVVAYPVDATHLMELVLALLGLGGLRTVEKLAGRTK